MAIGVALRSNSSALNVNLTTNSLPTVSLSSPISGNNSNDLTPTMQFVGTDADGNDLNYNIQIALDNTFIAGGLVDSNGVGNQSNFFPLGNGTYFAQGQSFTGAAGVLDNVKFYLRKSGSPTGNAVVKIYAHTGTYGTSSLPTGSALATSGTFNIATLTGSFVLTTFTFSGGDKITLTAGTKYVAVIEYSNGNSSNYVEFATDSSPIHSGNMMYTSVSSPTHDTTTDFTATTNSPMTFSHTCSGSDKYLLVGVTHGSSNLSSITYGGQSLSLLNRQELTFASGDLEVWGLVNPPSGSNSVVITPSGPPEVYQVKVSSWNNVDQTTPLGTVVGTLQDNQAADNSIVTTNSSTIDKVVAFLLAFNRNPSVGAGQTRLGSFTNSGGASIDATYEDGGSSVQSTWDWAGQGGQIWSSIGVPLKAAVATTPYSDDAIFEVNCDVGLLIDKVSDVDTGFANITNGADTQPFTQGNTIGYTVQSALTVSSTYYWRVRAKDASGYGNWSSTETFVATNHITSSNFRAMIMGAS